MKQFGRALQLLIVLAALVVAAFALVGCPSMSTPQGRPETVCADDCKMHASKCDDDTCVRGCRFVLDRLLEHEGHNVVACVAKAAACDDAVWADCAAKVGVHADGGPPAPPPPSNSNDDAFGSGD